jgi:tyrosyl-tRNA synthetase
MPLLPGLDGVEKMSKSLDNYIGISEPADVMFSKLMKVPDPLLEQYITLHTDLNVKATLEAGPVQAHRILARAIVADYHGANSVSAAEARFDSVAKGGIPDQMPEVSISSEKFKDGLVGIITLAVEAGFALSNGEARRLIQNHGLKLNGETVADDKLALELLEPVVLQKGKNDFKRLKRA